MVGDWKLENVVYKSLKIIVFMRKQHELVFIKLFLDQFPPFFNKRYIFFLHYFWYFFRNWIISQKNTQLNFISNSILFKSGNPGINY